MEDAPRADLPAARAAQAGCPNCRRLAAEVERLTAEGKRLKARVEQLSAQVAALEEELRRARRQAAPFSKDRPKKDPKPPGRGPGHPPAFRPAPPPGAVSEIIRVPLRRCPRCGGVVKKVLDNAPIYQSELPASRPVIRRFDTQRGWCPRCRKMVRSRHPEQTSTATGAAGSQLGPNALALAADLKHRLGLSLRKIVDLFQTHFGLQVTPGALAQAGHRLAARGEPIYRKLRHEARDSPAVHADETGWRIAARGAWLWVFATPTLTLYRIEQSRGHEVVQDVLGTRFGGTLVSDGLPTYDAIHAEGRQLCIAHLLKRCARLEEEGTRGAVRFPRQVARLLRRALALRARRGELSPRGFATSRGRLEASLDRMLRYHRTCADNERLAAHLFQHRPHLFTFLYQQTVEPTNNLAERQLRPAVIARKLSAGNRSQRGAQTHAVVASLAATCRQRGERFSALAATLLRQADHVYPRHALSPPLCA